MKDREAVGAAGTIVLAEALWRRERIEKGSGEVTDPSRATERLYSMRGKCGEGGREGELQMRG